MTWHKDYRKNGYAVFAKAVPQPLITAAREAIAADMRDNYDPARQQEYEHISFCPNLCHSKAIMDLLLQSPAWDILDEALGSEKIKYGGGQIAIRRAHRDSEEKIPDFHIDGIPSPVNGLQGQQINNFTALIGIFLSDTPRHYAGNFTVWPGSHTVIEKYFRDQGPKAMDMGIPKVELGGGLQLDTKAGDIVLCHYELAHTVAANTSDIDRIAVYFRISLNDIGAHRWELLTNIWNGWKI